MPLNIADNTRHDSLSTRYRMRRFRFFLELIQDLPRPLRVLDIGGTQAYWEMMRFNEPHIHITLLNLAPEPVSDHQRFSSIAGDATDLHAYANQSFDLVYSNSVIEHLFTRKAQQCMANEVRRVGKHYFIQTPHYYFPIEPHWVFPFFQFLPHTMKVWLTRNFSLGHIGRIADPVLANRQVAEIQLLTQTNMLALFPDAALYREKFLGFTKSIVAYRVG